MKRKFFGSAWRVIFTFILCLSLAGVSTREAKALTYTVSNLNNSGVGSLRQAIIDANVNTGVADTITFTVSGTITLTSSLPTIIDDLTLDGSGQEVTVDGNNLYRVLRINPGKTVTINHLSIANGVSTGSTGGAILNSGGYLTVTQSVLSGNSATSGGAIYNDGGTTTVTDSTFSANSADYGGAILVFSGSVTVANSTFSGNSAVEGGGGIHSSQTTGTNDLIVTNSTFSGNTAHYGGGIYSNTGTLAVTNATFSGNSATTAGADIYRWKGTFYLKNTILANPTSMEDCFGSGSMAADVNNLIELNSGCGTPASSADPMLGPLGNNGGHTQTFALLAGSPALDAGSDAACAAAPVSNKDQRGVTRPFGAHCDIGSYEKNTGVLTTRSVGTYDGYILESGETTNTGGTLNSTATTFHLGDEAGDKQYRAILSFNTASLPDTAVITKVTLKIRKQALVGTDPFTILSVLRADIRKPFFGTGLALVAADFQAPANRSNVGTFNATPVNNWYTTVLLNTAFPFVNKTGTTQFRLRFVTGDNDDGAADYMKFFSGNYATAAARPTLVIEYYVP